MFRISRGTIVCESSHVRWITHTSHIDTEHPPDLVRVIHFPYFPHILYFLHISCCLYTGRVQRIRYNPHFSHATSFPHPLHSSYTFHSSTSYVYFSHFPRFAHLSHFSILYALHVLHGFCIFEKLNVSHISLVFPMHPVHASYILSLHFRRISYINSHILRLFLLTYCPPSFVFVSTQSLSGGNGN